MSEELRKRREETKRLYPLDPVLVGDHEWVIKGDGELVDGEQLQTFGCPGCGGYLFVLRYEGDEEMISNVGMECEIAPRPAASGVEH